MADAGGDEISLEFTPTWVVALVCFSIVFISIAVDRSFRYVGKQLKNKRDETWPLIVASRKIRDELMLLGLISLLLAVFQTRIGKICMSERLANIWLPCNKPESSSTIANLATSPFASTGTRGRRLLAMASDTADYCSQKGKVPLLSVEAVHHLHIFIFVLATFHVVLCLLKVLSMMWQWRNLRVYDERLKADVAMQNRVLENMVKYYDPSFFDLVMIALQQEFFSMTVFEYVALRENFIKACETKDLGKDFQKHIMGTLPKYFENMIGIRWYLWLFAVIFLIVNVAGWHALFWMSFIPLILFLIVHFKLEFMIRRLAKAVAEKHPQNVKESGENGAKESVFQFSEDDFLFGRPGVVGNVIHFVIFENSLQLAFFFFILFQYGFHSCIMGKVGFVVPRIVIGAIVQVECMFRTLPLFAIIKSQMNLKAKQSDKRRRMHKIKTLLREYLSDKPIEKCLHDLDEIKILLKDYVKDEGEEMPNMTWISELIDERKNLGKEPSSPEAATDIELTQTGLREGSVGHETTEYGDVNPIEDIEAQKSPTDPNK